MRATEPEHDFDAIAVIGLGCRLPGGIDSPAAFWEMLSSGRDAIGEVPEGRWSAYESIGPKTAKALKNVTRQGGFLTDAAQFDAAFFGITPREAELMDPQQRIVLEVVWEALEHAGVPPHSLAGTDAGVFVGVGADDYGRQMLEDLPGIEAWTGIGAAMCAVANRVSYTLDLRGPSLAVDTACSASLVAIHQACQALRMSESQVALAGGINLMAGPGLTMVLDAAGATSPDGRSKSFDALANGYGRGEGAGIVVLKQLSAAQADGNQVLAVIRGSAVNQDGRTNGIMAPSEQAQEQVMRNALRDAKVSAATVDYVEAHGTGTRAGDPIEASALSAVFGEDRGDRPCLIGSVKPNIGHLEAGAGVAGVIKTVLSLHNEQIPPSINISEPNPDIPWDSSGLSLVTGHMDWPQHGQPRRAGVSGFGYGGTVAHVVMEQAPAAQHKSASEAERSALSNSHDKLLTFSGQSQEAVREYAGALAERLDESGNVDDIARTLLLHRSHLPYRAALAGDPAELSQRLRLLSAGTPDRATTMTRAGSEVGDAVWVFSGHGSQWVGMGRELLRDEPVFADVIDGLAPIFTAELGFSPRQELLDGEMTSADRIQPMIFAVQVALAAVWERYGVKPAAVIGHSVGEIAAAVTAGMLTMDDGATLICRRSALLRRVTGDGAMFMVDLPFAEVHQRLAGRSDVVAAISSAPDSTVVSGDKDAVASLAVEWEADGLGVRHVSSDVAFHSPHMDSLTSELIAATAQLTPAAGTIDVYSTALSQPRSNAPRDGAYWAANLRNPVRLAEAVAAAASDGHRAFLEISAHPVVTHSVTETLSHNGIEDCCVTGTLRRNAAERQSLLSNLGALHCHGITVDAGAIQPQGNQTDLPRIAWQHQPYWRSPVGDSVSGSQWHDADSHTLLGEAITVAGDATVRLWQTHLDHDSRPYPGSHPIHGIEVVPAAVLLNTFLAAANSSGLNDVQLRTPVPVTPSRDIQVVRNADAVRLASRPVDAETGTEWLTHTSAMAEHSAAAEETHDLAAALKRCTTSLPGDAVMKRLNDVGVAAAGFDWTVDTISRGDGEVIAQVWSDDSREQPQDWASLFDAVLSVAPLVFDGEPVLRMPARIHSLGVYAAPPARATIHVRLTDQPDTVDIIVADDDGHVASRMSGTRFGVLDGDPGAAVSPQRLLYRLDWREVAATPHEKLTPNVILVSDSNTQLCEEISLAGASVVQISHVDQLPDALAKMGDTVAVLVAATHDHDDPVAGATHSAWQLARSAQLLAQYGNDAARLWAITTGLAENGDTQALQQSPMWGLGRVISGEHPDIWGGTIDLDPHTADRGAATLVSLLGAAPAEDVLRIRNGVVSAARLMPVDEVATRPAIQCQADGSYVITGGLGVLGVEVAHWLAGRGARRLILLGRTPLPARREWDEVNDPALRRQIDAVRGLEALGVSVRTLAIDITDPQQASVLKDPDALGMPAVRGVVHAAGVLDNRMVNDLTQQSLHEVMRPKAAGAMVLHELFPAGSLDFLVLFSSVGLQLGLTGQASYASANSFMDSLARYRGADSLSLGWTSWRAMGMAANDVVDQELRERGVGDISAAEAFQAWEHASRRELSHVAVMRTVSAPAMPAPLLRELSFADSPGDEKESETLWTNENISNEDIYEKVPGEVTEIIAAELKMPADSLDARRPLMELGLDSVMTLVIRRQLETRFGLRLPATLLWKYPTMTALSAYLCEQLVARKPAAE